jgi:sugar phosphate isomerase/epimerase
MDRRTFLGAAAASWLAKDSVTSALRAASIETLGLQLYTVRDAMAKDFDGTIAAVAATGYKEVEFAGYFDRTPAQVRDVLRQNGLTAPSAHIDYPSLGDKLPGIIDAAHTIGHTFLVNPWIDEEMRKQPDIWQKAAETYNRAGESCRKAGIQFAYHNHHFEFVQPAGGRQAPYEILLKACDPALVKMEMDLCWTTVAGVDPLTYFQRFPGRFPLVHVKGLGKKPPVPAPGAPALPFDQVIPTIVDVGHDDVIDWKRIFARAGQAGIAHYIVEHDQPKVPFASIKASYDYLKTLKF